MKPMDDQKRVRDLRVTFPPIGRERNPDPPIDPREPPPRKHQCCGNCNAFAIVPSPPLPDQPVCLAGPPTPFFLGVQQTKTINPATQQPYQYPLIAGFQAPTEEGKWCRAWQWRGPVKDE
jgi:hypothetical protein